jgi:16S rRNA processing protein RimM
MSRPRHDTSLIVVGKVVSVNFPKRQVRVRAVTDHPERFVGMRRILLETADGRLESLPVEQVNRAGHNVVITLADGNTEAALESARNAHVVVRERIPLGEDEYYIDDLMGIRVVDESGRALGRLHAVYSTGANDVYEVRDARNRELLVPAIKERILDVDLANGVLTVDPEGLLDGSDED